MTSLPSARSSARRAGAAKTRLLPDGAGHDIFRRGAPPAVVGHCRPETSGMLSSAGRWTERHKSLKPQEANLEMAFSLLPSFPSFLGRMHEGIHNGDRSCMWRLK